MGNFDIRLNLKKLQGASVIYGKSASTSNKQYIVIPVAENNIFVGKMGAYLNLSATELKSEHYGDTHLVKVRLDKDAWNKLSAEERKKLPICGSMKPIVMTKAGTSMEQARQAYKEQDFPADDSSDDLDF